MRQPDIPAGQTTGEASGWPTGQTTGEASGWAAGPPDPPPGPAADRGPFRPPDTAADRGHPPLGPAADRAPFRPPDPQPDPAADGGPVRPPDPAADRDSFRRPDSAADRGHPPQASYAPGPLPPRTTPSPAGNTSPPNPAADTSDLPAYPGAAWQPPLGPSWQPPDAAPTWTFPAQDERPPGRARPRRHVTPVRFWLTVAAAVLGVAGVLASAGGLATQILPRRFSAAQQRQIMAWETASRWRSWPAGKIFPAAVRYQLPNTDLGAASGLTLTAHRAGIAPQSGCAAAADEVLARMLDHRGCLAMLRATYTDASDSLVVTVGVAVMRGAAPNVGSLPAGRGHGLPPTVKAVAFPGTLAAGFGDRQRQLVGAYSRGPYLVLYAAGYADGRPFDQISQDSYVAGEMSSLGAGIAESVGAALSAPPPPPRCPGAPGC